MGVQQELFELRNLVAGKSFRVVEEPDGSITVTAGDATLMGVGAVGAVMAGAKNVVDCDLHLGAGDVINQAVLDSVAGVSLTLSGGFGTFGTNLRTVTVPAAFLAVDEDRRIVMLNGERADVYYSSFDNTPAGFDGFINTLQPSVVQRHWLYTISGNTMYFYVAGEAPADVVLVEKKVIQLPIGDVSFLLSDIPDGITFSGYGKKESRIMIDDDSPALGAACVFEHLTLFVVPAELHQIFSGASDKSYNGIEFNFTHFDGYNNGTERTVIYNGLSGGTFKYRGCTSNFPNGFVFETASAGGVGDVIDIRDHSGYGGVWNDGVSTFLRVQDSCMVYKSNSAVQNGIVQSYNVSPSTTSYNAVLMNSEFVSEETDLAVVNSEELGDSIVAGYFADPVYAVNCTFRSSGSPFGVPNPDILFDLNANNSNEWKRSKFWGCDYRTVAIINGDGNPDHIAIAGLRHTYDGTGTGANTAETELAFLNLFGGAFERDGLTAVFTVEGAFAANANNKTVRLKFGNATLLDTGAMAVNNSGFIAKVRIRRTGANAQQMSAQLICNGQTRVASANLTQDLATQLKFAVTGQNGTAVANDIVVRNVSIDWEL